MPGRSLFNEAIVIYVSFFTIPKFVKLFSAPLLREANKIFFIKMNANGAAIDCKSSKIGIPHIYCFTANLDYISFNSTEFFSTFNLYFTPTFNA